MTKVKFERLAEPLRNYYRKDKGREVAGILCMFEIDPVDIPHDDLETLRKIREDGEAKDIAKWIIDHGQPLVMDNGEKTYKKVYKDITYKYDTYGGIRVRSWKILLATCLVCMVLGCISQAYLACASFVDGKVALGLVDILLLAWDIFITYRLKILTKRFWYRRDTL